MSARLASAPTEPRAFIAWESRRRARYELVGGGNRAHDLVVGNIPAALHVALRGGDCDVHGSNLKVVSPAGMVTYPDVFVRCGPLADEAIECTNPVVVFEVLSPSTRSEDLDRKRWAYQAIPILAHSRLRRCRHPRVTADSAQGACLPCPRNADLSHNPASYEPPRAARQSLQPTALIRGTRMLADAETTIAADQIICLSCGDVVEPGRAEWKCSSCGQAYPACLGIPDFRSGGGAQPAEVQTLVDAFDNSSFDELVQLRIPNFSTTNERLRAHFAKYRFSMAKRGKGFFDMARRRAEAGYGPLRRERALAIGCGVGASMIPMAHDFGHTVGIDPSLPDLILAKRAAVEAGVADRITLIQGYVQRMPLRAQSIDFALAEDVLEHVMDLDGAMQDIGRVLGNQGVFIGNSVNRFNMLRPEPHVKLWFLGFLPRRWQAPYARWRRNFIGYDERTQLPSYWELRRALRAGIGTSSEVTFPEAATFGFSPKLDQILDVIKRLPPVALPLLWIFPSHLALGRPTQRASIASPA